MAGEHNAVAATDSPASAPTQAPAPAIESRAIRLLIADDHPIVREGLKRIIQSCPDMQLAAEAVDAYEALAKSLDPTVDVLLLDVAMPGPGFLETLEQLRATRPTLPVLVLSVHSEEEYAVQALRAGAAGYLTKEQSPAELARAIRRVYAGRRYVTPSLAERLASELDAMSVQAPHELLSTRERSVFEMIVAGSSLKEIAARLGLSPKTVSSYRARLLRKMAMSNNADLVRYAVERRLLS